MNILWIEDFGGTLSSGTETLESMFKGLLSFDEWDEDSLNLIKSPQDLENFCKDQKSNHCIYLCRNYFDYVEFKANHAILNEIDLVISDINLENRAHVSLDLDIPEAYADNKTKFHANAGFFIFNDLIYLGFPEKRMCFMTGEKNSLKDFTKKCSEIYMPEVIPFEKTDADYENLRDWIKKQESDYVKLRRGIIEGCNHLKTLSEAKLDFNSFINETDKQISLNDMRDYLGILANFLPLRVPDNKTAFYKLFLRTLAHEWEAAKEVTALAWIMKSTRNWMAHNSNLFDALDEQMVAYLFIINMRLMFNLGNDVLPYEKKLFSLFNKEALSDQEFRPISTNRLMPVSKAYRDLKNLVQDENVKDAFPFGALANNIQESNSSYRNDKALFTKLLYQMFWLNTSKPKVSTGKQRNVLEIQFFNFNYAQEPYLFELARHIYNRSFSQG